jgi:murein endopeptidase
MAKRIPALCLFASVALFACASAEDGSVRGDATERAAGVPRRAEDAGRSGAGWDSAITTATALADADADVASVTAMPLRAPELPVITNPEPAVPPPSPAYECRRPAVAITKAPGCRAGQPYPHCRWHMPLPARVDGLYSMWRNTVDGRWWGRPALVGVLLAAAREYHRVHPEQALMVGDLDARGPRHKTHDRGVDVDLYLPGAMVQENEGAGAMPWNYWGEDPRRIEDLRWRVEELARILATCTGGKLRIYYNDPVVTQRFHAWFREQGYESPFGPPMQPHNELHQFHFHMTIGDDTEVPPSLRSLEEALGEGAGG